MHRKREITKSASVYELQNNNYRYICPYHLKHIYTYVTCQNYKVNIFTPEEKKKINVFIPHSIPRDK